ncbi:MAG: potassium-transporting ATPase subunit C, partial [Chthoniobacterales bacterium]
MKTIIQSLRIYLVLTVLTGILYPIALTGFAQFAFPKQANGSRLTTKGKLIGSDLLAQKFTSPKYFWPRPSAADFATVASGASNKGPTSADL